MHRSLLRNIRTDSRLREKPKHLTSNHFACITNNILLVQTNTTFTLTPKRFSLESSLLKQLQPPLAVLTKSPLNTRTSSYVRPDHTYPNPENINVPQHRSTSLTIKPPPVGLIRSGPKQPQASEG